MKGGGNMELQKLNNLKLVELKTWKQEIEKEIRDLDDELERLEEKVEKNRLRYSTAEKVFMHTQNEIFEKEFQQPFYKLFQEALTEYEDKKKANNSRVITLMTLGKHLDLAIQRYE